MLVTEAVKRGRQKIGVAQNTPSLMANSVLQLWTNAVSDSASAPAYTCLGQTLSYGETDQLARRVATYFQKKLNLKPGDRIAVQLPNIIQYPVVVIAALKLGLIIVNVNPMYSSREIIHQFNDADVKTVVVLDQFYETVKKAAPETNLENIIVTRPIDLLPGTKQQALKLLMRVSGKRKPISDKNVIWFKSLLKIGASYSTYRSSIDDVFALQYTGGTTGVSKGVKLTQKSLLANVAQCLDVIKINNDFLHCSTTISPLPLYHIYAYALCFGILPAIRGHSVLIPNPRDTVSFVKTIKKVKFDIFCGLNSLFVSLLESADFKKLDFSNLKLTLSGGMALMPVVAEEWSKLTGCKISEGYGMTEASPVISMNPSGFQKLGSAGIPLAGTEVKVIDDTGAFKPVDQAGELCIKGPQMMDGYWNDDEKTSNTIIDGWLHTGDIVTVDKEGYVTIVDRLKDMIIVSGFNVYPTELEQTLTLHEKVAQCAAIGVEDKKSGEVVKMFVIKSDESLSENDVRQFCKENMAPYKVPKHIEFRDSLPMSNVGKVLRKELA
ncbi:MAG: long-chain fatty acid--CoA ligase [SAR92 clade bacterium]|uniref:Long-chain-fatty-acid--CoA ligase n=1 Tax=SAR92 clade bacterium TaxID=2315479 RepID=A0A520LJU8_9GAMM|nr:MAG: long-chain fatty acid--CoA ligase [SAR92 clade bacterium]